MANATPPAPNASYDQWRAWVKATTGLSGSRLTAATREEMAKAGRTPGDGPEPPTPIANSGGSTDGSGNDTETSDQPPSAAPEGYYWTKDATGTWILKKLDGTDAATEKTNKQSAIAYLTDLLTQYGLSSLVPAVETLISDWGTNTNIIVSRLRQTPEYQQRFAGNAARIKNGYNAISEGEYLSAEDAIRSTMRRYGLAEDYWARDKLATLIGGDVSAAEVDQRIGQAKKVIDNADPNIKNSLVNLYGASMSDMLGYVLAPETALEVVQRRVNAGVATGVAASQGIDLGSVGDTSLAEQIGDLGMGDERTLRAQFANVGDLARSTERLGSIDNETVTSRDVVRGEFGLDPNADQKVKRLQSRERARFSGQSATGRSTLSGSGI